MEDFAYGVSRTRRLVNQLLATELERRGNAGLAPSHGDILAQLFANKRMRMTELSRRIKRDPSTVTALVRKLVKLGYAKTARDETDGRATVVMLTNRGCQLERDFAQISAVLRTTWMNGISTEDLATAMRVLSVMQRNLRAAIEHNSDSHGLE